VAMGMFLSSSASGYDIIHYGQVKRRRRKRSEDLTEIRADDGT